MLPLVLVLKLLRIALGYGSRTERIARMVNSPDPAVAITARSMMANGYLNRELGTVNLQVS